MDPREELAQTASDLAAAVAGLTCQEGEEEVSVDPDTLKADVVVISEPDWGAADPEIQEALVPVKKLEESSAVKAEARFEPGETPQEAISPAKADVEFSQPARDTAQAAASGEAIAVDQSKPASGALKRGSTPRRDCRRAKGALRLLPCPGRPSSPANQS